jgi:tRNA G46 methylase TrmB
MFSDVPFVPINRKQILKTTELLNIKSGDKVLEIGSGDGRLLLYMSKRYPNVNFVGIEINPTLVWFSNIKKTLVGRRNVVFVIGDALNFNEYGQYNKICFYMYDGFTKKLLEKYEKVFKKGTSVLSVGFGFGKNFKGTHNVVEYHVKCNYKKESIYLWKK